MRIDLSSAGAGDQKVFDLPQNTVLKIHRKQGNAFRGAVSCTSDGQHLTLHFEDGTEFVLTGLTSPANQT